MASYQFYNPAPVFLSLLGLEPVPGGTLTFYDRGTTNPRDTWSDPEKSVLNENPVPLDSAGRSNTAIFLDGEYTVLIQGPGLEGGITRDMVPPGDAALTIPTPTADYFLTSPDGVNLAWSEIFQMPDPTGSTNQYPVTNGAGYTLTNVPTAPDPEVVVAANSVQVGISTNPSKYLLQDGSGSAPASGAHTTQVAVVFPTAFSAVPKVLIEPTVSAVSSGGFLVAHSVIAKSETGFTVKFDTNEDSGTLGNIINPVTFDWVAHGRITVE